MSIRICTVQYVLYCTCTRTSAVNVLVHDYLNTVLNSTVNTCMYMLYKLTCTWRKLHSTLSTVRVQTTEYKWQLAIWQIRSVRSPTLYVYCTLTVQ